MGVFERTAQEVNQLTAAYSRATRGVRDLVTETERLFSASQTSSGGVIRAPSRSKNRFPHHVSGGAEAQTEALLRSLGLL